jgi:serine/threonine-protein kinase
MTSITCAGCKHDYVDSALFCPNCGRPKVREAASDVLIGKLLGERFQVQAQIGQGGSGTIYRAEHVTLRRKVAIKVLHDELSRDDLAVERFRREATTVAEIDNEHIVEIHDFGRTPDGRLYLAMELLEGETLDAVLARDKQLSMERTADILIQVGEALMEAHAIGYVHRDLRPRNVYLAVRRGKANFVKLLDFGLAKLVETDAQAASTSLGMTFGDPRYMSPEQARGDRIDRRADIYQLGCVAYEMLTGAPPFSGNRVFDILTKQVTEAPAPLPTRRQGTPLWMEAAVAKMLAKDPENRFATTTRMVEALRRGLETGEVMEDEVARRRESIPPPSVSRVMQKMGLSGDGVPTADNIKPPPSARSQTNLPEASETKRGIPPAGKPDSVEMLRKRTGTPQLGVPVVPAASAEAASQAPVAGTIEPGESKVSAEVTLPRGTKAAAESSLVETPRRRSPSPSDLGPAAARRARSPSDVDEPKRPRSPSEPESRRARSPSDVDEPKRARSPSEAEARRPRSPSDVPRMRGKRPTAEPGVSQVWFDEGDEQDGDRARRVISPSVTDDLIYDDIPRGRSWGKIAIAIGAIVVIGGVAFALTRDNTPDKPKKDEPAVATPVVTVDAAPSTIIESPDAAVAEATPDAAVVASSKDKKALVNDPKKPVTPTPPPTGGRRDPKDHNTSFTPPGGEGPRGNETPPPPTPPPPVNVTPPPTNTGSGSGGTGVSGGPQDPYGGGGEPPAGGGEPAPSPEKKAEFFANLGQQQLGNGDTTNAAQNFKKALEIDANNAIATIGMGEIALRQGLNGDAIVHLKKASRLAPKSSRVFTLLGEAYLNSGNHKEAANNFKKALVLDPANARARDGYNEASAKAPPGD